MAKNNVIIENLSNNGKQVPLPFCMHIIRKCPETVYSAQKIVSGLVSRSAFAICVAFR